MSRTKIAQLYRARPALATLFLAGCIGDFGAGSAASGGQDCTTLDFDTDGLGNPIAAGDVVEDAYLPIGVAIDVWRDKARTRDGLGVAFDSDNPTGGDWDLAFDGLGNLLINQENFTEQEVQQGRVAVPDDDARGALFEFRFDEPVCVESLILLDLDFDEDPAKIRFYDQNDDLLAQHFVDPMGDNVRLDVALPAAQTCAIRRMTLYIESSGAMDELTFCRTRTEPEIWEDVFDGGGDDVGNGIATDEERNVYVAGTTEAAGGTDGFLRKYDSAGQVLWTIPIGGPGNDSAAAVALASNGDPIVVGALDNGTDTDIFVHRYEPDGTLSWSRLFDGGGDDAALGVAVAPSGDIAVAGFATTATGTDIWVRQYSPSGATEWTDAVDGGATGVGHGVAVDDAGNVFVAAQVDNGTDHDLWVRKYGPGGGQLWTRLFDGGGDDVAYAVAVDPDGDVAVVGLVWTGADSDGFVRKYEGGNGATIWTETFGGAGADQARGVATDAGGNIVVHGTVGGATFDAYTIKYDPDGTTLWTEVFDRGEADTGTAVAVDIAGSVLVTGSSHNGSDLDLFVAKYRP
jgi:hypothetical protein